MKENQNLWRSGLSEGLSVSRQATSASTWCKHLCTQMLVQHSWAWEPDWVVKEESKDRHTDTRTARRGWVVGVSFDVIRTSIRPPGSTSLLCTGWVWGQGGDQLV